MIVATGKWHEAWLWLWYFVGASLYMIKRAFYQLKPPNEVATGLAMYLKVAGVPLLFRFALESAFFWVLFNPVLVDKMFGSLGWDNYLWMVSFITQFAPVAFITGLALDPMFDWFIPTVIGKIPGLKDWWPQMPGPMVVTPVAPEAPKGA